MELGENRADASSSGLMIVRQERAIVKMFAARTCRRVRYYIGGTTAFAFIVCD